MNPKLFEITCHQCNHQWFVKMDTVFHHEFQKNIDYIYDYSLFHHKCSSCGTIVKFVYPLVYYFPKQAIIISLGCEANNFQQAKNYRVETIEAFCEYIKIVDDGEDIDSIMALKKRLSKYQCVEYDGSDHDTIFFMADGIPIAVSINKDV